MKLYVTAVAIAMLAGNAVSAQHVNFGLKGGLNLYTIDNYGGSNKYTNGIHAGALGHIHLNRQWAIQPEATYSMQGTKYSAAGVETKIKLGYVNVPILVQYMFNNGFRIEAGPQVGFLVSAKAKMNGTKSDQKQNYSDVDFGVGAGVGYVHPPSGFGIDARYNFGISNINEASSVDLSNRGFQLGVFYLFKHKN